MSIALRPIPLVAALVLASGAALAQPASAPGGGPGPAASMPRGGMGPGGMGPGRMMGPRYGNGVTPGWTMMKPDERAAHRKAMSEAKTYDECVAVRDQHREAMQARAKERGVAMPGPRRDVCAGLPKP